MEFQVEVAALKEAATDMTGLSHEVPAALTYADEHLVLSGLGDSGVFHNAIAALSQVRNALTSSLEHLREISAASADELRATVAHYRETDDASEAELDRLYGDLPAPDGDRPRDDDRPPRERGPDPVPPRGRTW